MAPAAQYLAARQHEISLADRLLDLFRRLIGLPSEPLLFHDREQEVQGMPIYRLLQNSALGPQEIAVLAEAYEDLLRKLNLVDRNDPITEIIARKIIELGQRGVRQADQLIELAMKELGIA